MNKLEKYTFDPHKYPLIYKFYQEQNSQFWNSEEYTFVKDKIQYDELKDPFIKRLFEAINCFFLIGDGKISCSLVDSLKHTLDEEGMSSSSFLAVQIGNEMIHAVSYNTAARKILGEKRLNEMLTEIESLKCIKDKINFIDEAENVNKDIKITYDLLEDFLKIKPNLGEKDIKFFHTIYNKQSEEDKKVLKLLEEYYILGPYYFDRKYNCVVEFKNMKKEEKYLHLKNKLFNNKLSKGIKYLRLACGEGLFFMTQFILIGFFKSLNYFNDFCLMNNHIFKDEMLHCEHKIEMTKLYLLENEKEEAINNIKTALNLELDFLKYLLSDCNIPKEYDLDFDMVSDAAKMRANYISEKCGLGKIYNIERKEFAQWTTLIGGTVKNNFFEIKLNATYKTNEGRNDVGKVDIDEEDI